MYNIIPINDFNCSELDIYARLNENQLANLFHPANGIFIAESPIVVERALAAGYEPLSILIEDNQLDTCSSLILEHCGQIPIYTGTSEILSKLTGFNLTRGMLCAMRRADLPGLEALCKQSKRIAVLDNVVNPTNVGAIVRSAAALNIDSLILTDNCADPLYRRAIRVSMGTIFQLPWTVVEADDYLPKLKANGFKTVAMALKVDSFSLDNPILAKEERLAIILGSEGYGLSSEVISSCDYTVMIPMSHGVDSLNVAAASALAFWQLCPR